MVVRSGGGENPERLTEALAWAALDPRHAIALARARRAWDAPNVLLALRAQSEHTRTQARWTLDALVGRRRAFASMIGAAAVGTLAIFSVQVFGRTERIASDAVPNRVVLADGSNVTLDSFSAIEVTMKHDARLIRLVRGEAMFVVARDKSRPFSVDAEGTRVSATGTAFSVRMGQQITDLTVTEGSVRVTTKAGGANLKAGQAAAVSGQAMARVSVDEQTIARRLAWRNGWLAFDGETLEQAVGAFNRYRREPIVVGDPAIAGKPIRGRFATFDAAGFIDDLRLKYGIVAVTATDGTVVLTGGAVAKPDA